MTGSLIDNEQGGFRAGDGCVDQILTLKQIGKKAREKKYSVYGFYRFGEGTGRGQSEKDLKEVF